MRLAISTRVIRATRDQPVRIKAISRHGILITTPLNSVKTEEAHAVAVRMLIAQIFHRDIPFVSAWHPSNDSYIHITDNFNG